MEVGVLEPELGEFDADPQELQAAFAVLQRAFRPGQGRGKGVSPQMALAGLGLRAAPRALARAERSLA
eukprot:8226478-Alexandrium_andersonii.AAC.1